MSNQRNTQQPELPSTTVNMTATYPAAYALYSNETNPTQPPSSSTDIPDFNYGFYPSVPSSDALSMNPYHLTADFTGLFTPGQPAFAFPPVGSSTDNAFLPLLSTSSASANSLDGSSNSTSQLNSPQMQPPRIRQDSWESLPHLESGSSNVVESTDFYHSNVLFQRHPALQSPLHAAYHESHAAMNYFPQSQVVSPATIQHTTILDSPHQSSTSPSLPTQGKRSRTRSLSVSSPNSPPGTASGERGERGICEACGKTFKDLKTHMLTHQSERPEKCPIEHCEYHTKGFARRYDRNRHTLTHYKGTMICPFCPNSFATGERTFNRADIFKRHLTGVHQVEQVPPNSRKNKSPHAKKRLATAALVQPGEEDRGICSTCSNRFPNAQEFYEHLDECVLAIVQQAQPSESINEQHLREINETSEVMETLEKHNLPTDTDYIASTEQAEEEEDSGDESPNVRAGKGSIKTGSKNESGGNTWQSSHRVTKPGRQGHRGLTFSKGGVKMNPTAASGRGKRKKNYPRDWGCDPAKASMKKRVICVYDGERRLMKDDMMMDNRYEVRMMLKDIPLTANLPIPGHESINLPVGGPGTYVTDLDVQSIKRADAIWGSTDDERGNWIPDNVFPPHLLKEETHA